MESGLVMSVYVQLALALFSSVNPHRAQSKTSNMTGVVGASLPYAMQCRDGLRGEVGLKWTQHRRERKASSES